MAHSQMQNKVVLGLFIQGQICAKKETRINSQDFTLECRVMNRLLGRGGGGKNRLPQKKQTNSEQVFFPYFL